MNTTTHESLSELREFITIQAAEDAAMTPSERRWQAKVVTEVLGQQPLKSKVRKSLLDQYCSQVAVLAKS